MIVQRGNGTYSHEAAAKYLAEFNLNTHMAHYVAKKLHLRPNDILDTWGVAELLVAYGQYQNEDAAERYAEWKARYASDHKAIPPQPKKYAVRFIGLKELRE